MSNTVRVVFRPAEGIEEYDFANNEISLDLSMNRKKLSVALNNIMGAEVGEEPNPLDFKIKGQFLRQSLASHCKYYEIDTEKYVLEILYFPLFSPPQEIDPEPADDWISSIMMKGSTTYIGLYDGTVRNATNGDVYKLSCQPEVSPVKSFTFLPEGTLITGYLDGNLGIMKSPTAGHFIFPVHQGSVNALVSHPSISNLFISGGGDSCISIWGFDGDSVQLRGPFVGHKDSVQCLRWIAENKLVSASMDNTIRIWDVDSQNETGIINATSPVLSIDVKDNLIISGHSDRTARLWDLRQNTNKAVLETYKSHNNWVSSVKWCEADVFATASYDGAVKLWNYGTSVPLSTIAQNDEKVFAVDANEEGITMGGSGQMLRRFKFNRQ